MLRKDITRHRVPAGRARSPVVPTSVAGYNIVVNIIYHHYLSIIGIRIQNNN